jgi:hypothetical protein
VSLNPGAEPERTADLMTSELRYRVRGALPAETAVNAEAGTVFVRPSFDQRSRALLVVSDEGYLVRFEGFKKAYWEWRDVSEVRREFPLGQGEAACRYFNYLALSPGYQGPARVDLESEAR